MDRIDELEKRLKDLEDERELRELLTRYSFNADLARNQEYVDLYTYDDNGSGAIDLTDMGAERFQGPEKMMEFISTLGMLSAITGTHHAVPTMFYIDGDDAIGEGYSQTIVRTMDGPDRHGEDEPPIHPLDVQIVHANYSRWTFKRINGAWKIKERYCALLGSERAGEAIIVANG